MKLFRLPAFLALASLAALGPACAAQGQDTPQPQDSQPVQQAALTVPDAETVNPPTQERIQEVERVAAESGWTSVAIPLRSAAIRSYMQGRFVAADAWYNLFEWTALFSEPEDRFVGGWIDAMNAAHLGYAGVSGDYHPSSAPLGRYMSRDMQNWVLSNPDFSAEFFQTLDPVDDLTKVFAILDGLHRRDQARLNRYSSLALAIALVYDVPPPPYWPHGQVTPQALPRRMPNVASIYDWLTHEDALGHTYFRLGRLRAEELKFVVDIAAQIPELQWSQTAVQYPLDRFEGAYTMVKYRDDRANGENQMVWSGKPYTLQSILSDGGICIDQAYFASEAGKARGVPTMIFRGSGQDGRHAWFGFLDPGQKWRLDAGRYAEQRLVTGSAINPQTWMEISDHELQFLSERFRALPSFAESRVQEEFARDFLRSGDAQSASRAARMAVNYERRNLDAWQTLIRANQKLGMDPSRQEGVLREASLAFARYPDLVIWFENQVCESLRARGETSLANYEERGIAERLKGDRADLAIQQASGILFRSMAQQPIPDQVATYNSILGQFGHDAGTTFFDTIVTSFAEHLALKGERQQARDSVERAREVIGVQPGTQIATEVDKLLVRLQD